MNDTYETIYSKRGDRYHDAMMRWPAARNAEFESLIHMANLPERPILALDIPSGGGYLRRHLSPHVTLVSADPAESFLHAGRQDGVSPAMCCPHDRVPVPDAHFDAVLSLAGVHHQDNQEDIFREWRRLLKKNGILAVGDVRAGSPTACFLDEVVDRFNSMGHRGRYFTPSIADTLTRAGFRNIRVETRTYDWPFACESDMTEFCRILFGMDRRPSDSELLAEIARTTGYDRSADGCRLHWELLFVRAMA